MRKRKIIILYKLEKCCKSVIKKWPYNIIQIMTQGQILCYFMLEWQCLLLWLSFFYLGKLHISHAFTLGELINVQCWQVQFAPPEAMPLPGWPIGGKGTEWGPTYAPPPWVLVPDDITDELWSGTVNKTTQQFLKVKCQFSGNFFWAYLIISVSPINVYFYNR